MWRSLSSVSSTSHPRYGHARSGMNCSPPQSLRPGLRKPFPRFSKGPLPSMPLWEQALRTRKKTAPLQMRLVTGFAFDDCPGVHRCLLPTKKHSSPADYAANLQEGMSDVKTKRGTVSGPGIADLSAPGMRHRQGTTGWLEVRGSWPVSRRRTSSRFHTWPARSRSGSCPAIDGWGQSSILRRAS